MYSFGIGQDTSFDQSMIERYGVAIHGFDPTPTAAEYVAERRSIPPLLTEQFKFAALGVWDSDCILR